MPTETIQRAYSVVEIKAMDDEKRVIEGIATTPSTDRMGDVIEPEGMQFKLPIPLLNGHNSDEPIGNVIEAKVTRNGIRVRAQIAAPGVANYIDEAWRKIKAGLIRGLSIGFRSLRDFEDDYDPKTGAFHFEATEWLELSAVTIPANADATILTVKSADSAVMAALGKSSSRVVRLTPTPTSAGVSVSAKDKSKMTIKEQIAALEAKRAANDARMDTMLTKSAEEGRTFDATEQEEYDGLAGEVKSIDEHLDRLRKRQEVLAKTAAPVVDSNPLVPKSAAPKPSGVITVQSMAPKGVGMARAAICQLQAKKQGRYAPDLARQHYPDMPELELYLKTAVEAGDTTTSGWASQLVSAAPNLSNEFLELLRPATIVGRIPGLRRVPFNVAVPLQTAGGTYGWVGEAYGKPVTSATFSSVTLRWAKAAGIIVITQELARFSSPSAEMIIRDEMINGCARFLDQQFVGTAAEVSNISPAGILNGISSTATTGTAVSNFRTDMNNMLNNFTANNVDPSGIVLLMSATQALALSLMVTDLGVRYFPDINTTGGSVLGIPVVVSENVGTKIIGLNTRDILLAEDGGLSIDVSTEASVEMETTPAIGEQSPLTTVSNIKSFWQNNLVGFRVERFITWKRGRDSAVEYITANAYVP